MAESPAPERMEGLLLEEPRSYADVARLRGQQVLFYEQFGSWQGEWFLLAYDGEQYLLYEGWYGSCSGCDDIEANWSSCSNEDEPVDETKLREWLGSYRAFAEIPAQTARNLATAGTFESVLPRNVREMNPGAVARECEVLIKLEENLPLVVTDALNSGNQEIRRRVIEEIGIETFMQEVSATTLDVDGADRLMAFGAPHTDEQVYLCLKDASTPREYVLRVPPDMERVRQAKAWSFGIAEHEYAPEIET